MKQYKLLEISTQYDQYLSRFYNLHGEIEGLSYDELFSVLVEDAFAESDFIHRELNKMGIESKIIFCNNRNLQKKWKHARNDMTYFEILLLQIKDFRPDIVLISDVRHFSIEETKMIQECLFPKRFKMVAFHFTSVNDAFLKRAALYDQIYTGNRAFVKFMKEYGMPAYLLRHAFEPSILKRVTKGERKNEICFLGSIFIGENLHNNRVGMLCELINRKIPYDFYGNIYGSFEDMTLKNGSKVKTDALAEIERNRKLEVFGIKYYTVMNQYNICLNLHALCGGGGCNMRMFEATGMGTCLLTDSKDENAELFDISKEIVVYESYDDMVQKAKWLLENPKETKEIALAGQRRTLKEYTYRNKAEQLNEYLQLLFT